MPALLSIENYRSLKLRPTLANASPNLGNELFPNPWNCNNSCSVYLESFFRVVIPLFSKALLAGAETRDRNPSFGLLSFSHMGQVGQSLLL